MIQADISERTIFLDGFFGPAEDGGIDGPTFREVLDRLGPGDVFIVLNSPGGSVVHGEPVVQAIRNHPGHVTTIGNGLVGSQAVGVFLAGDDRVSIGQTLFMIHGASVVVAGPRRDLEDALDVLERWDAQSIEYYIERTGLDRATVEGWHNDGRDHWFNPTEALELGIVTDVRGFEPAPKPATEGQRALAAVNRNAEIRGHKARIDEARDVMTKAAQAKQQPRPAEQAATVYPESAPIAAAAMTEQEARFDRWRRLQNLLDIQFKHSLERRQRTFTLTGVLMPKPERLQELDTWKLLNG